MSKHFIASLAALSLTGCLYTPQRVRVYDAQCQVYANYWTLKEHTTDSFNCGGNGCMEILLAAGAVSAASAVVSGSVVLIGNTIYWYEKRGGCPDTTRVVVTTETTADKTQWSQVSAVVPEPDRTLTLPVTCAPETSASKNPSEGVHPQAQLRWPSQVKKAAVVSTAMSTVSGFLKAVGGEGGQQEAVESIFVPCLNKAGLEAFAAHALIPAASEYSPKSILASLQTQRVDAIMRLNYLGIRWHSLTPTKPLPDKTYKDVNSALSALMSYLPEI